MKLNNLHVQFFTAATKAALQADVQDFLNAVGAYSTANTERELYAPVFYDTSYISGTELWSALVQYTE